MLDKARLRAAVRRYADFVHTPTDREIEDETRWLLNFLLSELGYPVVTKPTDAAD